MRVPVAPTNPTMAPNTANHRSMEDVRSGKVNPFDLSKSECKAILKDVGEPHLDAGGAYLRELVSLHAEDGKPYEDQLKFLQQRGLGETRGVRVKDATKAVNYFPLTTDTAGEAQNSEHDGAQKDSPGIFQPFANNTKMLTPDSTSKSSDHPLDLHGSFPLDNKLRSAKLINEHYVTVSPSREDALLAAGARRNKMKEQKKKIEEMTGAPIARLPKFAAGKSPIERGEYKFDGLPRPLQAAKNEKDENSAEPTKTGKTGPPRKAEELLPKTPLSDFENSSQRQMVKKSTSITKSLLDYPDSDDVLLHVNKRDRSTKVPDPRPIVKPAPVDEVTKGKPTSRMEDKSTYNMENRKVTSSVQHGQLSPTTESGREVDREGLAFSQGARKPSTGDTATKAPPLSTWEALENQNAGKLLTRHIMFHAGRFDAKCKHCIEAETYERDGPNTTNDKPSHTEHENQMKNEGATAEPAKTLSAEGEAENIREEAKLVGQSHGLPNHTSSNKNIISTPAAHELDVAGKAATLSRIPGFDGMGRLLADENRERFSGPDALYFPHKDGVVDSFNAEVKAPNSASSYLELYNRAYKGDAEAVKKLAGHLNESKVKWSSGWINDKMNRIQQWERLYPWYTLYGAKPAKSAFQIFAERFKGPDTSLADKKNSKVTDPDGTVASYPDADIPSFGNSTKAVDGGPLTEVMKPTTAVRSMEKSNIVELMNGAQKGVSDAQKRLSRVLKELDRPFPPWLKDKTNNTTPVEGLLSASSASESAKPLESASNETREISKEMEGSVVQQPATENRSTVIHGTTDKLLVENAAPQNEASEISKNAEKPAEDKPLSQIEASMMTSEVIDAVKKYLVEKGVVQNQVAETPRTMKKAVAENSAPHNKAARTARTADKPPVEHSTPQDKASEIFEAVEKLLVEKGVVQDREFEISQARKKPVAESPATQDETVETAKDTETTAEKNSAAQDEDVALQEGSGCSTCGYGRFGPYSRGRSPELAQPPLSTPSARERSPDSGVPRANSAMAPQSCGRSSGHPTSGKWNPSHGLNRDSREAKHGYGWEPPVGYGACGPGFGYDSWPTQDGYDFWDVPGDFRDWHNGPPNHDWTVPFGKRADEARYPNPFTPSRPSSPVPKRASLCRAAELGQVPISPSEVPSRLKGLYKEVYELEMEVHLKERRSRAKATLSSLKWGF